MVTRKSCKSNQSFLKKHLTGLNPANGLSSFHENEVQLPAQGQEQQAFVFFWKIEMELRRGRVRCWRLIFPGKAGASGPGPCWQPKGGVNNGRAGTGLPATRAVSGS